MKREGIVNKKHICVLKMNLMYRKFYFVARNMSTQSINVDIISVFFYGVKKDDE